MAKSSSNAPKTKKPQTAEERRTEARQLAERLSALIGAEHTPLSELLIEAANQIPADSTPVNPNYAEQHGYLTARKAKPFEIAAAKLIKRHASKTDANTIYNGQRMLFLKTGIGSCSAGSLMTQNASKDYLNAIFENAFIGVDEKDGTLIVKKKPPMSHSPFHMGMSSSHGDTQIKEMLQSMFPGYEIVEMGDDF